MVPTAATQINKQNILEIHAIHSIGVSLLFMCFQKKLRYLGVPEKRFA